MDKSQIIETIIGLYQKHGASGIVFLCLGLILALFFNALLCHWAAKTLRVNDSSIGKGMLVGFWTMSAGLILAFIPGVHDAIHGTLILILVVFLVQNFFQVSILKSIAILLLADLYLLLHAAVAIFAVIWLIFD